MDMVAIFFPEAVVMCLDRRLMGDMRGNHGVLCEKDRWLVE